MREKDRRWGKRGGSIVERIVKGDLCSDEMRRRTLTTAWQNESPDNRVLRTAVNLMIRRVSDQGTSDGRAGCWGMIDCEKPVCENRESHKECNTLSQL